MKKQLKSLGAREDGKATRQLLIECAGRLIAENGYANTTSKSICEAAKVNLAAINYHFGSRDGLYLAVLKEVHKEFMSLDSLQKIWQKAASPQEKLNTLLDKFASKIFNKQSWHIRVWAREVFTPSPFIKQILTDEAFPKFQIVLQIFAAYTNLPLKAPELYSAILAVMSPYIVLFLVNRDFFSQNLPFNYPQKDLTKHLKKFALGGLKEYSKQ